MGQFFYLIFLIFIILGLLLTGVFVYSSVKENERRAILIGLTVFFAGSFLFVLGLYFHLPWEFYLVMDILVGVFLIILILPFNTPSFSPVYSDKKFDERDIVFSRNLLKKGTKQYNDYYSRKPELQRTDDNFRENPGLLNPNAKYFNRLLFLAADVTFKTVEQLSGLVDKPVQSGENKLMQEVSVTTNFILNWINKMGAVSTGITELKPHHVYSFIGRGKDYGKEVALDHKYAIVFTVEMEKDFMDHAPYGPTVVESATQYLNVGLIAVRVAEFIRSLGYEARAHIDANYRVICPLVAQDAGLGIIGRMGLLMTPQLGPRVRIGVVTTNIPLQINEPKINPAMIRFCRICKKCAVSCPSRAIPFKGPGLVNKNHWQINSEACFTYWTIIGTDCGRCVSVCPYSHPDTFIHNLVRNVVGRNPVTRWIALKLDNFLYGAKPKPVPLKKWMMAEG